MIWARLKMVAVAGGVITGVAGISVVGAGALTGGVQILTVDDAQAATLVGQAVVEQAAVVAWPSEPRRHGAVDPAWVSSNATRTGIPAVELSAYANAALAVGRESPGCHLGWTTIAAIGEIESGHGTHGGAGLDADGRPSVPIIGPALDGRSGYAAIASDADSAARHGDSRWDHAVGPFQFIGSTWQRWQADGDGDGVADPQDVDDAALAAARYLCAAGGDLRTGAGWSSAIYSYNHDDAYVAAVLAVASRDAQRSGSAQTP